MILPDSFFQHRVQKEDDQQKTTYAQKTYKKADGINSINHASDTRCSSSKRVIAQSKKGRSY